MCVRESLEKQALDPKSIEEIQLPVIKYGCKRRCGEKQMSASVSTCLGLMQAKPELVANLWIHAAHVLTHQTGNSLIPSLSFILPRSFIPMSFV